MKPIYAICAAALLTVSCNLDRSPLDKLSEETYFETESGLLAFSNAFYNCLPGSSSLYEDDADTYIQNEQLLEARGKRTVPASGSGWTWTYLRNFNTLLDNAGQCQDEAVRTKYMAIARFFRAYFYFEKVKRFGDVPWIDTQLSATSPDLYAPRDSRDVVMQHVIEDLDYAVENLPSDKSAYTVTKWTALALKSRACLFEGTFRKYHALTGYDHDADWYLTECAEASLDFIQNSGYSNYDAGDPGSNYLTLFTTDNIAGSPVASDVILARNYNAEYSVVHYSNYTFNTASMGKFGMTRKMVCSYLMKDGTRFTDIPGWQTKTFVEETADRDPRLSQSIRTPGYHRLGDTLVVAPDLSCCITGYQPIKYVTTTDKDAYGVADNDLIIFRTAEVYLNYAEAKAELGTVTASDLQISVDKVRARVGMPAMELEPEVDPFLCDTLWGGYVNVTGPRKALILEIRRERSVELAQEGFRYYDLMRWKEGKIFEQQMYGMYFPGKGEYDLSGDGEPDLLLYKGSKPSSTAPVALNIGSSVILSDGDSGMINPYKNSPGSWDEAKDYLYPIPTDELNLNPQLVQNPGWEE